MAIALQDKPNVEAPSALYPHGNIKDNPGDGSGTPVNKLVYGDFHQFFDRLLVEAGIVPNGEPDNAYSGFQYIEALKNLIQIDSDVPWRTDVVFSAGWSAGAGFGFRKVRGVVHMRGKIICAGSPQGGDSVFTLPVGYRPLNIGRMVIGPEDVTGGLNFIDIYATGVVYIYEMGITGTTPLTKNQAYLDNTQFDTSS